MMTHHPAINKSKWIGLLLATIVVLLSLTASYASSYVIADNETGFILEGKDRDNKVPVGGLTKIALAVVLLDWDHLSKLSLETLVDVPPNALTQGATNPLGLQSGDRLSLRDLLYLSLFISDDVAATTIANAIGERLPNPQHLDPVGNFVSQMNALASELEMKHTLFLNPGGYSQPQNQAQPYSSATDIARLVRYAYSKPGISFYASQQSRTIHVQRGSQMLESSIINNNQLLKVDHIDGVAASNTRQAGGCLSLTSEHSPEVKHVGNTVYTTPRRIIVVLLNSNAPFAEGVTLDHRGWSLYNGWASEGRSFKSGRFL